MTPRIPGLSDLVRLLYAQTEALAALPGTLQALNRSVRGLADVVGQARDTAVAVQNLAVRLDRVVAELEEPITDLGPGLRRLAVVLNDPVIEELPDTLRTVTSDVLPVLRQLRETQERVAGIAATTDRIMGMVDETGNRLATLPGASLWNRRRPPGAQPATTSDEPAADEL